MVPLFFFLLSLQRIWFRSSMDRMKDSGSFDWGSSPHGITEQNAKYMKSIYLAFVFCCNFQNFVRQALNFDAFFYIW